MFRVPERCTYAFLRHFHGAASVVMASTLTAEHQSRDNGLHDVALWTRGVDLHMFAPCEPLFGDARHPVFLYVGRVSMVKNIQAFLELDLPGSKVVAGIGPALESLKVRFPRCDSSVCSTPKGSPVSAVLLTSSSFRAARTHSA